MASRGDDNSPANNCKAAARRTTSRLDHKSSKYFSQLLVTFAFIKHMSQPFIKWAVISKNYKLLSVHIIKIKINMTKKINYIYLHV